MPQDVAKHILRPQQRIVVPVTQHTITEPLENTRARHVGILALGMVPAIELDDQLDSRAQEIRDIAIYWHLPAEPESTQLPQLQISPEMAFRIGCLVAEVSGA